MAPDSPVPVFDWFSHQFTPQARAGFVAQVGPELLQLFSPGDRVLDLCCGAGAISFFFEEHGATVTAIDLSDHLIALAQEEARQRGSGIHFLQGDVLTGSLGEGEYDLVTCFGNAVLDFPHRSFPGFRDRVHQALKPAGCFALQYRDGVLRVLHMREPPDVVEEGVSGPIQRHFQAYDPERGAYLSSYHHLVTGLAYEGIGYVYTVPLLRLLMEAAFAFERSICVGEGNFLDLYVRR